MKLFQSIRTLFWELYWSVKVLVAWLFLRKKKAEIEPEEISPKELQRRMELERAWEDPEKLFEMAAREVVEKGVAVSADLQRGLGITYFHAQEILTRMEKAGIIGPGEDIHPRPVLVTREQLDEILAGLKSQGIQYSSCSFIPQPAGNSSTRLME